LGKGPKRKTLNVLYSKCERCTVHVMNGFSVIRGRGGMHLNSSTSPALAGTPQEENYNAGSVEVSVVGATGVEESCAGAGFCTTEVTGAGSTTGASGTLSADGVSDTEVGVVEGSGVVTAGTAGEVTSPPGILFTAFSSWSPLAQKSEPSAFLIQI